MEKFWVLKQCLLFHQLSDQEIRQLESRARVRTFARSTPVYLPADDADGVLLLISGRVKICHLTPDGKQSILALVEPGELFGELSLFEASEREDYAEATEASKIILIPKQEMLALMKRHANVTLEVTRLFGLRRKRIERRLKHLLFRSNRERLTHLLLELAEQYGTQTSQGIELAIKLSHQDMANMIGSTRETVTVLLGDLQSAGLIKLARRKVAISNLDKMADSVSTDVPEIGNQGESNRKLASFS